MNVCIAIERSNSGAYTPIFRLSQQIQLSDDVTVVTYFKGRVIFRLCSGEMKQSCWTTQSSRPTILVNHSVYSIIRAHRISRGFATPNCIDARGNAACCSTLNSLHMEFHGTFLDPHKAYIGLLPQQQCKLLHVVRQPRHGQSVRSLPLKAPNDLMPGLHDDGPARFQVRVGDESR